MHTVPSLTQPQAVNIMMEAHTNGLAVVIICAREHAEFYCETLKNYGLISTIEPDE
jgi:ATP-dependent Clp protease adaptor protein ClpS